MYKYCTFSSLSSCAIRRCAASAYRVVAAEAEAVDSAELYKKLRYSDIEFVSDISRLF